MYILHYICIFYIDGKTVKKKVFWGKNLHRKSFKFKDFRDMYILHNQGIFYILSVNFTILKFNHSIYHIFLMSD